MALAALFFVEAHSPALPSGVIVLDAHGDDGANTREAEGHDGDYSEIMEAHDWSAHSRLKKMQLVEPSSRIFWTPCALSHEVVQEASRS